MNRILIITGGQGTGKSALAQLIQELVPQTEVIECENDNYVVDAYPERPRVYVAFRRDQVAIRPKLLGASARRVLHVHLSMPEEA